MGFARARHSFLPVLLGLAACSGDPYPGASPPPPEPAAVVVFPEALVLPVGTSAQVRAQVDDASGQPIGGSEIHFSVGDPTIATVSAAGLVTAIGPAGVTTLRVTSGRREARAAVRVLPVATTSTTPASRPVDAMPSVMPDAASRTDAQR